MKLLSAVRRCILIYMILLIGILPMLNSSKRTHVVSLPQGICANGCQCLDKGSIILCQKSLHRHVPRLLSTTIMLDLDHNEVNILYNSSFIQAQYIQIMSLANNGIIHIEAGAFVPLAQLRILRLGKNFLSNLPRNIFWNNRNLEILDLHGNSFVQIPDHIMYPLNSLHLLNMSNNQIKSAHLGSGFKYTTKLSVLDLAGNKFKELDAKTFQNSEWWDEDIPRYLNFSYCRIERIHPVSLAGLKRIESLSLAGNAALNGDQLKSALHNIDVSNLHSLNLAHMNITDINEFFSRFQHQKLHQLDLSYNRIYEIRSHSFYYFTNLQSLDLSNNNLETVSDFDGLSDLLYLSLANNDISKILMTDLEGLHTLQHLNLSYNRLQIVDDSPFENLWDLKNLDLSHNKISYFKLNAGLENLQYLDFSMNSLTNMDFVKRLLRLNHLDMSYNYLTHLSANMFSKSQSFASLNFSHNVITSIDDKTFLESHRDVLDLSYNRITYLDDFGWYHLKELYMQGNLITNISISSFDGMNTLKKLDLKKNNLYGFPLEIIDDLFNLRYLILSYNPIGNFLVRFDVIQVFNTLRNLEHLELAFIDLWYIPRNMFTNLSFIKFLDLSGNQLHEPSLPSLVILPRLQYLSLSENSLSVPNMKIFLTMSKLRVIDLSFNSFQCTCELMPFRNWLLHVNITIINIHSLFHYQCTGPPEWKGVSIHEFHLQTDTCSNYARVIIFAIVGSSIIAMSIVAICLLYKYRWQKPDKLTRTQYFAISETSTIQVNHHTPDIIDKEWV